MHLHFGQTTGFLFIKEGEVYCYIYKKKGENKKVVNKKEV